MSTEILARPTVEAIVAARDLAMERAWRAIHLHSQAVTVAALADKAAREAHGPYSFRTVDRASSAAYKRLFEPIDTAESMEAFRRKVDASVWMRVMALTRMDDLMDHTAKEKHRADLEAEVPPVSVEGIYEVLDNLRNERLTTFARGLATCFSSLDRRFKSHDAFKLGSRIIICGLFDQYGYMRHDGPLDYLTDIERVFAILDGEEPAAGELRQVIRESRNGHYGPRQGVVETRYFKVRTFQNGNAHLWMLRDDLVEKANRVLADYYGDVLPDAVVPTPEAAAEADLHTRDGALARDLAFYRTPPEAVKFVMRFVEAEYMRGMDMLEPSAGDGAIARALLDRGARVHAIEVHPERANVLDKMAASSGGSLTVQRANFLRLTPRHAYDVVVMNPPFVGTHWMEHVTRAYDWLRPGGRLFAILPVTAEMGETRKHRAFRRWAQERTRYPNHDLRFRDLPERSFAASGTNINTVMLKLYRGTR